MGLYYNKKVKKYVYEHRSINNQHAEYNIILSGRGIGKSYSIAGGENDANDDMGYIKRALEKKACVLGYIRRLEKETKGSLVCEDFADKLPLIKKLSGGAYDNVVAWQGFLYFAKYDDELDKMVKASWSFGRIFCMATASQFKSKQYPDIEYIVYEEFVTDDYYLKDEPRKFVHLVSTIARDRENVKVYLIGNTVSRVCPYIEHWGLHNIAKQKVNSIECYDIENEDGSTTRIAVEVAPNKDEIEASLDNSKEVKQNSGKRSFFFGHDKASITGSAWQTKEHKKLTYPLTEYDEIYKVRVNYPQFSFYICYLVHNSEFTTPHFEEVLYIYPATTPRNLSTVPDRLIENSSNASLFITPCLLSRIPIEQKIYELLKLDKVAFSDNLAGEDFRQEERQENLLRIF